MPVPLPCCSPCSLDPAARYYGDNLASSGRYLEKARKYYDMNVPCSTVSHVRPVLLCFACMVLVPSVCQLGLGSNY
jgi:hypothetical protein